MATLISNPKLADFVLSEASGQRSRENAVVTQTGDAIRSGQVMMKSGAKWVPYALGSGSGDAVGILYTHLPAKTGDSKAVIFARDCEVNRHALVGLDTAAVTDLATVGILVRGTAGLPGISTPAL